MPVKKSMSSKKPVEKSMSAKKPMSSKKVVSAKKPVKSKMSKAKIAAASLGASLAALGAALAAKKLYNKRKESGSKMVSIKPSSVKGAYKFPWTGK